MRFIFVALAFLATAYAALPSNEYLPPLEEVAPLEEAAQSLETSPLADDGYRYKTVKRYRLRHRRDVNELPLNEYLPPVAEQQHIAAPVVDIPVHVEAPAQVAVAQESAVLADDGYRYKTVKRIRYRHRRDVNELPSNEYLPPVEEAQVSIEAPAPFAVAQESAVLADDGYRYKTVRRVRYRHRRDVNELPTNEYLPPVEEAQVSFEAPAPVAVAQESAVLADDGYRYKTVKRIRYRHRRDVNELPSNEYLPPVEEAQVSIEAPAPFAVAQESAVLADDGYRYKTVRRVRYRHRRDVNELPTNEYLPPVEEAQVSFEAPAPVAVAQESAVLADDGYRYKTVKRIRYRHRRDVNELPSNEYLPPVEEAQVSIEAPAPFAVAQESAVLADDGYRYKTVRRVRYRHRRDVNELPTNEYLPPVEEAQVSFEAPAPVAVAQESAVLADDGYRYKTVKRIRYRHRRDVNELPTNEYLPPVEEAQVSIEAPAPVAIAQESAVLADDGYRYKTVRRVRYRHRRDVNELPSNEYLPPVEEAQVSIEAPAPVAVAQESAVLADDGYRYKTVRRIRYRHRRDVNELPTNEYLPPVEEAQVSIEAPAPVAVAQESAVLADDGYRYKTVRRIRYRHRRDVNELPTNEYLPPVEEAQVSIEAPAPVAVAQESAVLADDGYRYKTVRRIRYRHRRDVNELPTNEYLPPVEEAQVSIVAPAPVAVAQESAVLADDGYRYKTVKRVVYRHRL